MNERSHRWRRGERKIEREREREREIREWFGEIETMEKGRKGSRMIVTTTCE